MTADLAALAATALEIEDHAAELAALSAWPHKLHAVRFDPARKSGDLDVEPEAPIVEVDDLAAANAVSSEIAPSSVYAGMHTVAIDIDVPARLVPSSTGAHNHLYVDCPPMRWETYLRLLHALADAGVIEPGYVSASERRGHTTLRLPWIKKGTPASD